MRRISRLVMFWGYIYLMIITGINSLSSNNLDVNNHNAVHSLCSKAHYPELCMEDLNQSLVVNPDLFGVNPKDLVSVALKLALNRVYDASHLATDLTAQPGNSFESSLLQDCADLMDDVGDLLTQTIGLFSSVSLSSLRQQIRNIRILLSSSLSLQSACSDGFDDTDGQPTGRAGQMLNVENVVYKGIANCFSLTDALGRFGDANRRRLFSLPTGMRKLLQTPVSSPDLSSVNSKVAQDGTGDFTTVQEAIDNVPKKRTSRYTIYIKTGIYKENVVISKKLKDLTLLGDGIGKTIITGNRNVALQKITTFRSATVAVSAPGFRATGITFRNTAGPAGHQAVALRISGDLSVLDGCSFEGYQDTLYALAGRQVYRHCDIHGTVDYIFGNAIAVFQNCNLYARLPMQGQQNTYTAQGRKLSDDPSGYSFQNCTLTADSELASATYSVNTYLGRPWKAYSRTVFIGSNMGSLVQPAGWLSWNSSEPYQDTLYYGEYKNTGPGSNTSGRVTWPGVHSTMSDTEASLFSVANFIATSF